MINLIIILPLIGSLILLPIKENNSYLDNKFAKQIGLSTSLIVFILTLYLFISETIGYKEYFLISSENFSAYINNDSIFNYNDSNLKIDTISIFYILLTSFITPICLLSNWNDITYKSKYFVISFLILETLQISFFLVSDLLLFYIFFESVLIPLFMIIGIWGASKARIRASFLLFLYTLAGSLPFLLSILWINSNLGTTSFDSINLYELSKESQSLIWYAIMLAFCVKSPTYPFHLWLFRAHSEAPLAGSILLAATILKFATYGFLRVGIGLMPDYTSNHLFILQSLAIITLIYSSLVTIRQTDTKAIIAYSSIAHVSIMILGLFSNNLSGVEGAILLSLAHGLVSPALFIIVGGIMYNRYHTRVINYYRGLTMKMPVFSLFFFLFIIFNASAPLSLNFIGEFLSLIGLFNQSPVIGVLGSTGIVLSAIYSIFLYNRVSFLGFSPYLNSERLINKNLYPNNNSISNNNILKLGDLNRIEFHLLFPLLIVTVILGIFPNVLLDPLHYDITSIIYKSIN